MPAGNLDTPQFELEQPFRLRLLIQLTGAIEEERNRRMEKVRLVLMIGVANASCRCRTGKGNCTEDEEKCPSSTRGSEEIRRVVSVVLVEIP